VRVYLQTFGNLTLRNALFVEGKSLFFNGLWQSRDLTVADVRVHFYEARFGERPRGALLPGRCLLAGWMKPGSALEPVRPKSAAMSSFSLVGLCVSFLISYCRRCCSSQALLFKFGNDPFDETFFLIDIDVVSGTGFPDDPLAVYLVCDAFSYRAPRLRLLVCWFIHVN
jgi:hypothetical protein